MKTPPLHLIESFLAFTAAKNMAEAASSLGLSQPALSAHLKSFEICFPTPVFAQQGRKKVLTPFGDTLRETLRARFENLDQTIKAVLDQFDRPENIQIRIAGRKEVLQAYAKGLQFSGTLIFVHSDGESAVRGVEERKYELAISRSIPRDSSLHQKRLFSDRFVVLYPRVWQLGEHQLFSKRLLKDLLERPHLAYAERDMDLEPLLTHFRERPVVHVRKVLSDWPALVEMVELNQGWSIAPHRFPYQERKVVAVPLPSSFPQTTDFHALYRKESLSQAWFKDLLQQLKDLSADLGR